MEYIPGQWVKPSVSIMTAMDDGHGQCQCHHIHILCQLHISQASEDAVKGSH